MSSQFSIRRRPRSNVPDEEKNNRPTNSSTIQEISACASNRDNTRRAKSPKPVFTEFQHGNRTESTANPVRMPSAKLSDVTLNGKKVGGGGRVLFAVFQPKSMLDSPHCRPVTVR